MDQLRLCSQTPDFTKKPTVENIREKLFQESTFRRFRSSAAKVAAMRVFQEVLERVLPDSADRKGSKTGGAGTRDSQPEVARSGDVRWLECSSRDKSKSKTSGTGKRDSQPRVAVVSAWPQIRAKVAAGGSLGSFWVPGHRYGRK